VILRETPQTTEQALDSQKGAWRPAFPREAGIWMAFRKVPLR
jgi:hypothetical protein